MFIKRSKALTHTSRPVKEAGHKRLHSVLSHLYELSRAGKFMETERRLVVAQGREGRGVYRRKGVRPLVGVGFLLGVMVVQPRDHTDDH